MDRLRQTTHQLRNQNYDLAMIQGTRWSLDECVWSNDYKVYSAPAAKASSEAHAGVCIIVDMKLLQHTRVTENKNLEHRIMTVRLHSQNYDMAIITPYAPGEHAREQNRTQFWTK